MSASVEGEGVNLGLIITPMLDMAFQLMAFFIMVYQPSALEGHIDGNLLPPRAKDIKAVGKKEPSKDDAKKIAADPNPNEESSIIVIVKAVRKGEAVGTQVAGDPTRIQLKRPESPDPETISDTNSDFKTGLRKLESELKKIYDSPSGGEKAVISIEADPDLRHEFVVNVYDVCRRARFKSVGFIAPPENVHGQ
jgi:biopolymer transport protein ExbD